MLLQGSSAVRFANTFLGTFELAKDFVLVAINIGGLGNADFYTLFQEKDSNLSSQVCYILYSRRAVLTLRRSFITKPVLLHKEENGNESIEIEELKRLYEEHDEEEPMESFYRTQNALKRKRSDDATRNNNVQYKRSKGNRAADIANLMAHGYDIESSSEDNSWERMTKVRPSFFFLSLYAYILALDAFPCPRCASTIGNGNGVYREESLSDRAQHS
jgi:hypothetical protein